MKKIILMMACAIAVNSADAQYVIGTKNNTDLNLMTQDSVRATLLGSGALIFEKTATGLPLTDPMPNTYGNKVVLSSQTDLVIDQNSYLFVSDNCSIVGAVRTAYKGTDRTAMSNLKSYIKLAHPSDGSTVINSSSSEMFLQPDDGTVYVGKAYNASLTTNQNSLSVDGSAGATGYSASIKEVDLSGGTTTYTMTNDDYTILVTGSSTTTSVVSLPTTAVEHGRIFHIKNIGADNITVSGADNGSNYTLSTPNKGITVQLLFTAPSTWTYHIISTM
ncbi:MAG: hypothetical protein R2800_08070 [Flavipsychrobacter sp.]